MPRDEGSCGGSEVGLDAGLQSMWLVIMGFTVKYVKSSGLQNSAHYQGFKEKPVVRVSK